MENVMSDEWKDKYFEEKFKNSEARDAEIMKAIRANTRLTEKVKDQAEATNGRVLKLEDAVYKEKPNPSALPPFYRDPKVIQIGVYVTLAGLLLVAAATRVDVTGLLP
jgi:GTP1/Obg family GTP-binding protein